MSKRTEVSVCVTVNTREDGARTANVSFSFGMYGKVGYRSAYLYLEEVVTLGGESGWALSYKSDKPHLDRVCDAIGYSGKGQRADGRAKLLAMITAVAGVRSCVPSEEERERDATFAREATESEERDRGGMPLADTDA